MLLLTLVALCPVITTDFMVAGGIAPVSYVLFYSYLYFEPIMLIYVFEALIYIAIFYFFTHILCNVLTRNNLYFSAVMYIVAYVLSLTLLIPLSLSQTYTDIAHNPGAKKNIIELFGDHYNY